LFKGFNLYPSNEVLKINFHGKVARIMDIGVTKNGMVEKVT
jgi:hypothetical protein